MNQLLPEIKQTGNKIYKKHLFLARTFPQKPFLIFCVTHHSQCHFKYKSFGEIYLVEFSASHKMRFFKHIEFH